MIIYLINFISCSGLLLLTYRIFLSSEKTYRFNRFYLMFSLFFSLTVPLLSISIPYNKPIALKQQIFVQTVSTIVNNSQLQPTMTKSTKSADDRFAGQSIAKTRVGGSLVISSFVLYLIVTLVMLLRFVANMYRIRIKITSHPVMKVNNINMVLINSEITPHSFFKYVFVNKGDFINKLTEPEIICHEQAHANQFHSLDILFIEILKAICWFNPFIPLYSRAIRLNHELLADDAVIKNHYDTAAYQHLVLAKLDYSDSMYLASRFNYLTTKKRLTMMTKITSAKNALYKQFAIVPVLTSAVLLFGQTSGMAKITTGNNKFTYNAIATLLLPNKVSDPDNKLAVDMKNTYKPKSPSVTRSTATTTSKLRNKKNGSSVLTHSVSAIDTPKNTFSVGIIKSVPNSKSDTTVKSFSVGFGKQVNNSGGNNLLDLTGKLIVINGKVATTEEIKALSLAKVKYMMPFKGTDDLGAGTFEKEFGEKAKNGGIMIILKSPAEQ